MSTRAAEYRTLIEDILAEDAALRAKGLPGLEEEEWVQLKDIVAKATARRNERFILGEYAHEGLKPHHASDGTLVSLALARQLGVKLEPIESAAE